MPTTKSQLNAGLKLADVQANQAGLSNDQIAQKAQNLTDVSSQIPKQDYNAFKKANPNLNFTQDDLNRYNSASPTINSDTLKPAKALSLPPQVPQTLASGTQAYIQSQNNSVKTEQQNALDLQRKELDRNKNDIVSVIDQLGHPTADKNAEYEAQGVNTAKKQVDEYTSQLEAEQVANAHQVTALRKNALGTFSGGMEQEINRINQDSLTKQADLAILQNNALRRYSTAAEIADRTLQAKIEPLQAKLDALKFFYTENKADFNKADDRAYTELLKKQEADTATKKENITKAFSSGLRNSFINEGGKFFRASDGEEFETPEAFFAAAGVSSFDEAYQKGLVGDLTFEHAADLNDVLKLRTTYPDAGISITDSFATAVQKLSGSNKYLLENKDLYPADGGATKPTSINGQDYFYDATSGQYVAAGDFVEGGAPTGANGKPLSAESSKLSANVDSGLAAINEMTNMLNEKGTISIFAPNPFNQTRKQYFTSADNLVDIIGRIRSGGAITDSEEARFKALLPKALDDKNTWTKKINQLKALLSGVKDGLTGGSTFNSAGTASSANQVKAFSESTGKLQPITFAKVINETYKPGTTPVSYGAKSNECGYYARQVVSRSGYTYPTLGDGLNSKIAAVQKYGVPAQQANIGAVIVTRENPTYGHVAVILQKTPQGVIVTESNFAQSGKISNGRLIPWSKIIGAINPTKA